MAAVPLTATNRIELTYTVLGKQHKLRVYCKVDDALAVPPTLVVRDGGTPLDWDVCAQALWDFVQGPLGDSSVADQAILQERIGIAWVPRASMVPTGASGAGATTVASQATWVVRDTAFRFIRFEILEHALGYVGHSGSGLGLSSPTDDITNGLADSGGLGDAPYFWVKSRGDRYILPSGAIAGLTFDLNDQLKRVRGLE